MERLPSHVRDIPQQMKFIRECDKPKTYKEYVRGNFTITRNWLLHTLMEPLWQQREIRKEQYRFKGLVVTMAARIAFPSIAQGIGEDPENLSDPRRQLVLLSRMGKLDGILIPKKQGLFEEAWKDFGEEAYGAYGLFFKVKNGQLTADKTNEKGIAEVRKRFYAKRNKKRKPIYLPDPKMSKDLADLNFTLNDVRMPDQEFETQVLPKVGVIFAGIIDPVTVFVDSKRTMTKKTIFA